MIRIKGIDVDVVLREVWVGGLATSPAYSARFEVFLHLVLNASSIDPPQTSCRPPDMLQGT